MAAQFYHRASFQKGPYLQQEGLLLFYRPGMKHMRGKDRGKKVVKGEERRGRSGNELTDSC